MAACTSKVWSWNCLNTQVLKAAILLQPQRGGNLGQGLKFRPLPSLGLDVERCTCGLDEGAGGPSPFPRRGPKYDWQARIAGNSFPRRVGGGSGGASGYYPDLSLSQALRPRLSQPISVENLAKALKTPGPQDFLRTMSTGRRTWNHLLCENFLNYRAFVQEVKKLFMTKPSSLAMFVQKRL